jgi:glycosyltransferase involved in cell wall biosynthesis
MNVILRHKSVNDLELYPANSPTTTQSSQPTYALLAVQGHVSREMAPDERDRHALYMYELGFGLAQRGCRVDIFVRRDNPDQPEMVEHFPGCRTIRLTAGPASVLSSAQAFEYLPAFVYAWLDFQQHSNRHYTLLHTSDWLSAWVGLQLKHQQGLPLVHTCHTVGALKYLCLESPDQALSIRHNVEQNCLAQADGVVVPSMQAVEDLRQMLSVRGKIEVIPYGVDTEHFCPVPPTTARQQLGIATQSRLILYVGWFDPFQGIETLLKACAFLPQPFQLCLVNDSDEDVLEIKEEQFLRKRVQQLGLEDCVVFAHSVPRSQLPLYYAAADVCVVPSYYQPSNSVILESMASGTPVIVSDIDRLQNTVIHGSTGFLVPPYHPNMLSAALWEVFRCPYQWKFYGIAARGWVQTHFSRAAMATQMQALYQSFTSEKKALIAEVDHLTSNETISLKVQRRHKKL